MDTDLKIQFEIYVTISEVRFCCVHNDEWNGVNEQ